MNPSARTLTHPTARRAPPVPYPKPGRPVPPLSPNSPFSSLNPRSPFPWRRRHTLGELPQITLTDVLYRSTSYHDDLNMDTVDSVVTREHFFMDRDGSTSPTPSDRSDSSGRSFLTSETFQMVQHMDKHRGDPHQSDTTAHWQTKPAVDPAVGSRPWFYRRYSHQVQANSAEEEPLGDIPIKITKRTINHSTDDWDLAGLQTDMEKFVERQKREKNARGQYVETHEDYDSLEVVTEDPDQSHNSLFTLGDSGYLTPSSAGDISMEPVVIEVPHYDISMLPVEAVNPADYPELVAETSGEIPPHKLPTYTSRARLHLINSSPNQRQRVRLTVLSGDQLNQYRKITARSHTFQNGVHDQDLLIDV